MPFPQASSLLSFGAVDSTNSHLVFWEQKWEWKTCMHRCTIHKRLTRSHCCLLSDLRCMVEQTKAICMQGHPSAEESSLWRWGSLACFGWRRTLILGAYRGWGLGSQSKRLIHLYGGLCVHRASLVDQRLKHLPSMRKTQVWSLGWEDPLEKEMVTHSSILAWRIPRTGKPDRL